MVKGLEGMALPYLVRSATNVPGLASRRHECESSPLPGSPCSYRPGRAAPRAFVGLFVSSRYVSGTRTQHVSAFTGLAFPRAPLPQLLPGMPPSQPIVTHMFTADPRAHVFEGRLYVYPSHDIEAGIP